jgi:anti-anti-sigma factor
VTASTSSPGRQRPEGGDPIVHRYPPIAALLLRPPWAVIRLRGEVDSATAPAFRRAVADALDGAQSCLVDLRAVTFFDSGGLGVLARLVRSSQDRGTSVHLVCVAGVVRTSLQTSGLLQIVPETAVEDLPDALRELLDEPHA